MFRLFVCRSVRKITKSDRQLVHASVLPSIRMEQLGSNRTDFHKISYLSTFRRLPYTELRAFTPKISCVTNNQFSTGTMDNNPLRGLSEICDQPLSEQFIPTGYDPYKFFWIFYINTFHLNTKPRLILIISIILTFQSSDISIRMGILDNSVVLL
jgi:hypothetical protein